MQAHLVEGNQMSNFDTLQFAKRALQAGFTKEQAEFQAEELVKLIDERLATKADIRLLKLEIRSAEHRITIKMGSMMVIAVGLLATILKLF